MTKPLGPKFGRPPSQSFGTCRKLGGGRIHLGRPGHVPKHGHSGNTTGLHVESVINEEALRMAGQVSRLLPSLIETSKQEVAKRPYGMRGNRAICPDCFTENRRYDEKTGRCPDCQR